MHERLLRSSDHKADEYLDAGHRTCACAPAPHRATARRAGGSRSGASHGGAVLFHVRDGKVTRLVGYFHRERALEAVGLSEQDAHADS